MVVQNAYFLGVKCNQGTSARAKYSGREKNGKTHLWFINFVASYHKITAAVEVEE